MQTKSPWGCHQRLLSFFPSTIPYPFQLTEASMGLTWVITRKAKIIIEIAAAIRSVPTSLIMDCFFIFSFTFYQCLFEMGAQANLRSSVPTHTRLDDRSTQKEGCRFSGIPANGKLKDRSIPHGGRGFVIPPDIRREERAGLARHQGSIEGRARGVEDSSGRNGYQNYD